MDYTIVTILSVTTEDVYAKSYVLADDEVDMWVRTEAEYQAEFGYKLKEGNSLDDRVFTLEVNDEVYMTYDLRSMADIIISK